MAPKARAQEAPAARIQVWALSLLGANTMAPIVSLVSATACPTLSPH